MTYHGNKADTGECNGCCPSCTIGSDDMDHADSSDVTPPWLEDSGDFEYLGGALHVVSEGIAVFDTPHPDGDAGNQNLQTQFVRDDAGQYVLGIVAWADDQNYLAAKILSVGDCDFLRLIQVAGGVETTISDDDQLLDTAALDLAHHLKVCWKPGTYPELGELRAYVKTAGGRRFGNRAYADAAGSYTALGGSTDVVFRGGFSFKYMEDDEHAQCPDCNTGTCDISSDPFTETDRSACLWDGGSASAGRFTTSGFTKHRVFHPMLKPNMQATTSITDWEDGRSGSVYVGSVDAVTGLWAEFEATSTTQTVTLYRNEVELNSSTLNEGPHADTLGIIVCYDGFTLKVQATCGDQVLCVDAGAEPVDGGKFAALAGSAEWGPWTLTKTFSAEDPRDECPDCDSCEGVCSNCLDDVAPNLVKIVASGFGGPGSPCFNCANINGANVAELGTYLLKYDSGQILVACAWQKTVQAQCDGSGLINSVLQLALFAPGDFAPTGGVLTTYVLYGFFRPIGGAPGAQDSSEIWAHDFGTATKPDCTLWNNLQLDPVHHSSPSTGCQSNDPLFVTSL